MVRNKFILFFVAAASLTACKKDLPMYMAYDSYDFAGNDANGGTWTPILLTSVEEVAISAPTATTSATYLSEIKDVKKRQGEMTHEQHEQVNYWTNNPVNRWNEIALELIAKYNLIPGPNEDDTYTLPNSTNPDGPPGFPFAHPPYAVRALAYLSVAQFDGLIAAWHCKYTYNRLAPYMSDSEIENAYPKNDIPSYPSDGAVVASASRAILSIMFPLEVDYLAEVEKEHLACLILSGSNVQSDIDAGKVIGEYVAGIALTRASTDGMKNAQTNKAVSDSIKAAAFERFGWQWENLELPVRPVGLTPLYGKVKMWSIDHVEDVRPIPPPAIDSPELHADIVILKNYADNITEEYRRIANFWQDGLGTYTPPGHWNTIAKELIVKNKMNPLRTARTYAYLNMAMMDAGISCWDAKYYYHYPRPIQLIEGFETIAGTPNFPSYTSGHSVFSAAGAEVLAYIFPSEAATLRAWAKEAALSRVYGGIHWTFDATIGTEQGRKVAEFTVELAAIDGAD